MIYNGKAVTILNQRSRLWTHPYDYRTPQKATLSSAGCGVFSICHCGQWLTGKAFSPEELADFSKDIVHVVGRLNSDSFMPLQTNVLSGNCMNYRDARVSELKEVSGNRDVS